MPGSHSDIAAQKPSPTSLFGHGSIYALATVAPVLTGFLITPLVTRTLGQYEYGVVALGLASIQLGQVLASAGLPASITRHVAIEQSGRRGAAGQVVFNAAIVAPAVTISLGALFVAAGTSWAPSSVAVVLLLASVSSALLAIFTSAQALVRGLSQVRTFVLQSAGIAVIPPLIGLAAATRMAPTAVAYASGLSVGHFMVAAVVIGRTLRHNPPAYSGGELAQGLRIGLPTVPHQLATMGATSLLVLFAGLLEGKDAAGRMQLALIVGTAPILVIGAFNNSWAVQVYQLTESARRSYVERSTLAVTSVSVVLSLSAGLVAPEVIQWLAPFGENMDQMAAAAVLVAAAAPFMVLYLANMHLIFVAGTTMRLAITTPFALVVALSLGLVGWWMLDSDFSLLVMSVSLIAFYAVQGLLTAHLRRLAGWQKLDVGGPVIVAGVGLACSFGLVAVQPSTVARAVVLTIFWIALLLGAGVRLQRKRGSK